MKKFERTVIDKLQLDIVEYAFVEWLIHRGIFTAFKANCGHIPSVQENFRDYLRDLIRHVYRVPHLGPECLVTSAFLFTTTPEGYDFWTEQSDAWERFYASL